MHVPQCSPQHIHGRTWRESSHGTKELFNLPPLVLKARHLSGSAFCWIDIGLPEQAAGGLGLVVEDRPTELSCIKHIGHIHHFDVISEWGDTKPLIPTPAPNHSLPPCIEFWTPTLPVHVNVHIHCFLYTDEGGEVIQWWAKAVID